MRHWGHDTEQIIFQDSQSIMFSNRLSRSGVEQKGRGNHSCCSLSQRTINLKILRWNPTVSLTYIDHEKREQNQVLRSYIWAVYMKDLRTMQSREVPMGPGRPSKTQLYSSGSYTPCGCSRHLSQWWRGILDTPVGEQTTLDCLMVYLDYY